MRKQTKLVAVMSAAALLAIGASMTSFAATKGWVEENGVWMYLDSDGDAVTEEWKKSGSQYFWLDENGEMATDMLIDDDGDMYFVDANGARVLNDWRQVDNEDGWTNEEADEEPESIWYYFGSNGKAVTGKKTINGKTYFFDEDGEMFYSWHTHNEKMYYLGDENEGWAYTGWHWLELRDEIKDNDEYDDDEAWFHFKSSGEMRQAGSGEDNKRAYINGAYYGFDEYGVMVDGWRPAPVSETAPIATGVQFYTEDNGNQPKGWIFTYTIRDWDDKDDDEEWFYLDSKGVPFNIGSYYNSNMLTSNSLATKYKEGDITDKMPSADKGRYTGVSAKYIKKKTYVFGSDGVMLNGVLLLGAVDADAYAEYIYNGDIGGIARTPRVGGASSQLEPGFYYFNKNDGSSKGQMETGKVTINYDGENYYYNFRKKNTSTVANSSNVGAAYTSAIVDNILYDKYGARVDSDESKEILTLDASRFDFPIRDKDDRPLYVNDLVQDAAVVVSSSGKLKQKGTVTIDGTKYELENYVVK